MSERKLKCARCGKWFKAADYKHLLCPACTAAEKQKRQQAAPAAARPAAAPTTPTGPNGRVAAAPAAPSPAPTRAAGPAAGPAPAAKPAAPARQGPAPRQLTAEERTAIERRYIELAVPQEFDGIRAQIAAELSVPKSLVKAAVNDLRQRQGLLSWWEVQQGELPAALVERVRERYVPLLPLPPIGVHRTIAEELQLTTLQVYRAIGLIRKELGLSKFNEREDAPKPPESAPAQPEAEAART